MTKTRKLRWLSVLVTVVMCFGTMSAFPAIALEGTGFSKTYTLTGDPEDDIVAVAKAQEGRTQSQMGYSSSWCSHFVGDCAELAGQKAAVPPSGWTPTLKENIINAGGKEVSTPQKGDIVFYYCKSCGREKHAAIAISSTQVVHGNFWYDPDAPDTSYSHVQTYKIGVYEDDAGHTSSSGTIYPVYVRPKYSGSAIALSSLSVTTSPATTVYEDGTAFSTAGMVVTAKYSDGTSKAVTGYKTSYDFSSVGTAKVTISYTENSVTKSTSLNVTVQNLFKGAGTAASPYQISSASDLQNLADAVNNTSANGCYGNACYIQMQNIDLSGINWIPIGRFFESETSDTYTYAAAFNGIYYGNYKKITNLSVDYDRNYGGLFGKTYKDAAIYELSVSGNVTSTGICVGGIVGEFGYGSVIRCCDFTGTVTGGSLTGGIIGRLRGGGTVSDCYVNADITATAEDGVAGGLIGNDQTGFSESCVDTLCENSYFAGTVSGTNTGGISGISEVQTTKACTAVFTNTYYLNSAAAGAVNGTSMTGCSGLNADTLKSMAEVLGDVFADTPEELNDGYPVFVWQAPAPFDGSGTAEDPYQIATKEDLENMRDLVNNTAVNNAYGSACYIQTADIDLAGESWEPIGLGHDGEDGQGAYNYTTRMFYGTYDGGEHTITNLNVDGNWQVAGLFAYIRSGAVRQGSATVKNLVVYGTVNAASANCAGGIAGQIQYGATIENCAFIGGVTAADYAGGITGSMWAGDTVVNCYHNGSITSAGSSGGIAGTVRFGSGNTATDFSLIENCYHAGGNVTGTIYSGGIIGEVAYYDGIENTITVNNCYFTSGTADNILNADATADNTAAISANLMTQIAADLGDAYTDNANTELNDGYPVFPWQAAAEEPVVYGDTNQDGSVSIVDVIMLNKYVMGSETLDEFQLEASDVDISGKADAADSLIILKSLVDLIESLPLV